MNKGKSIPVSWCLFGILLLSLVLRLWRLDWGLPDAFHRWTYHPDEPLTLMALKAMGLAQDTYPYNCVWGTFYLYLHAGLFKTMAWFNPAAEPVFREFYSMPAVQLARFYLAGRMLTVFWGMLGVWAAYLLGTQMQDRRAGLLCALSAGLMPFAVIHSHYMTPHIQFAALVLLGLYCCLRIVEFPRLRWYMLCGICSGLAFGTY